MVKGRGVVSVILQICSFHRKKVTDIPLGRSIDHPAEFLNPYYQNQSCDPFTASNKTCELGNYASYSINVTGLDDVRAGMQFAQSNNVRLVIKNTGHE
jgi:hypothetical protein